VNLHGSVTKKIIHLCLFYGIFVRRRDNIIGQGFGFDMFQPFDRGREKVRAVVVVVGDGESQGDGYYKKE